MTKVTSPVQKLRNILKRHKQATWWSLGGVLSIALWIFWWTGQPTGIKKSDLIPVSSSEGSKLEPVPERVPDYTIDGFRYVAIEKSVKQWELRAKRAFFYQKEGIVRAESVDADLYDKTEKITHVLSNEAHYSSQTGDLELYGDVRSQFPDGLFTQSEFLNYEALNKSLNVPASEKVSGHFKSKEFKDYLEFQGYGLKYSTEKQIAHLLQRVSVHAFQSVPPGIFEMSTIESEQALIDRTKQSALFFSTDKKVLVNQPKMTSQSWKAEFSFGGTNKKLRNMRAFEEVRIEEVVQKGKKSTKRIATAGQAEFDSLGNTIVLTEYPQVYQEQDTLVGDRIIVHRNSDLVEVEQSNALTQGKNNP